MANLIITIISIALVAVAAIMGVYYGGIAFENAQIGAYADTIVSEAQQILTAERMWSVNNGQPDISGMPPGTGDPPMTSNGVTDFAIGANGNAVSGTGMSLLVSSHVLSEWPPLAGNLGGPVGYNGPASIGPAPNTGSTATGAVDTGCYLIAGQTGGLERILFAYKGGNYVMYYFIFGTKSPSDGCSWATLGVSFNNAYGDNNYPILQIAEQINAKLGQVPADANTSEMTNGVGITLPPLSSSPAFDINSYLYAGIFIDSDGTLESNYCYGIGYNTNPTTSFWGTTLACVFGPS